MFTSKKFFLVQRVPFRASFIDTIEQHGGRVVRIEAQADYIIADHLRKDAPPGSISYKFIEEARRTGVLPEVDAYRTGEQSSTVRLAGSTSTANKSTRTPFTAADDLLLWRWITSGTGSERGNEIYKGLALKYPHHTFQSWRDRWIKYTSQQTRPAELDDLPSLKAERAAVTAERVAAEEEARAARGQPAQTNADNTPAIEDMDETEAPHYIETTQFEATTVKGPLGDFTQAEFDSLLDAAESIEETPFKDWKKAWRKYSTKYTPKHTAQEWEEFYLKHVQPEYHRLNPEVDSEGSEEGDSNEEDADTAAEKITPQVKDTKATIAEDTKTAAGKGKQRADTDKVKDVEVTPVSKTPPMVDNPIQRTEPAKRARESAEAERPKFKRLRIASDDAPTKKVVPFSRTDTSEADNLARMQLLDEDRRQRVALTRENLAQMTATTKTKSKRAADLPVDDEADDQEDFVAYLGGVLGSAAEKVINDVDMAGNDDQDMSDEGLQSVQDDLLNQGRTQHKQDGLPDDSSQEDPGDVTIRPEYAEDEARQDEPESQSVSGSLTSLPVSRSRRSQEQDESLFVGRPESSSVSNFPGEQSDEDEGPRRVDLSGFEVAEPEGGWDNIFSSQQSTAKALPTVEDVLSRKAYKNKAHAFETQDVYNAETQQIDFDMPEPEADLDDLDIDEQEPFEGEAQEDGEDLEKWMQAQVMQGYDKEDISKSLYCSCNRTELAEDALEYFGDNAHFPTVWSGFWSEQDDRVIEGTDANEIKRAEKLHGTKGTEQRRRFLAMMRDGEV